MLYEVITYTPKVVSIDNGEFSVNDLLVHNEKDTTLAFILSNMTYNDDLPRPMGVFQAIESPSYDERVITSYSIHYTKLYDVWDEELYYDDNTIMVHISHLRTKIEADSKNPQYIKTIKGLGYKLHKPNEDLK